MQYRGHEVWLSDDGTLDTVVEIDEVEHRWGDTSRYRDKYGVLTEAGLKALADEVLDEI
jgi:hypothetical protein